MRRHPALQDLSRDHFVALNHVVAVRRVAEGDRFARPAEAVRAEFLDFARGTLMEHFQEEDETLVPMLEALAGDSEHAARAAEHLDRIRSEHADLRAAVAALGDDASVEALHEAARALREHVRWEEDALFESLQEWSTPEALDALAASGEDFRRRHGLPLGPA